jgi:hypothetical protein
VRRSRISSYPRLSPHTAIASRQPGSHTAACGCATSTSSR